MAYKTKDLFDRAKKEIVKNNLYFIGDVSAFIGVNRSTFYDHFPNNTDNYKELSELLEANKIRTKTEIRAKLHKGEKAAELLALYRLICTPDERQNLNQSYIDHSTKGKEINNINLNIIESEHTSDKANQTDTD